MTTESLISELVRVRDAPTHEAETIETMTTETVLEQRDSILAPNEQERIFANWIKKTCASITEFLGSPK